MNSDNRNRYKEAVKAIGNVSQLSTEQLIETSRELFETVSFCDCELDNRDDRIEHRCNKFWHHDYIHSPICRCCQKVMLLYYLGWCMEKLADNGRLPEFNKAHSSHTRISERTFDHIRIGSGLIFRIIRHLNAWKNETKMQRAIQTWLFHLRDLNLKELSYDASTIGISIRRLMESRSLWEGTATELLSELRNVAETLNINTKIGWPQSPRKLNQVLQDLKEYLERYGIAVEKQRYIKLLKA
jgi:hypothetical protein